MDTMADDAAAAFHGSPEDLNCSQVVAMAAGETLGCVIDMKAFGGGRAHGGLCGALYSAMLLAPPDKVEALRLAFKERHGGVTCKELRGTDGLSCSEHVRTAAELLEAMS